MPYRVITGDNGVVKIASTNAGKEFAPEEISALVLRKLTDDAAKFLGDKVGHFNCRFASDLTDSMMYCLNCVGS